MLTFSRCVQQKFLIQKIPIVPLWSSSTQTFKKSSESLDIAKKMFAFGLKITYESPILTNLELFPKMISLHSAKFQKKSLR